MGISTLLTPAAGLECLPSIIHVPLASGSPFPVNNLLMMFPLQAVYPRSFNLLLVIHYGAGCTKLGVMMIHSGEICVIVLNAMKQN